MRASYLDKNLKVYTEEIDIPQLDSDQVLVKVESVGICGSDVHYYKHGAIGPYIVEKPIILGHELSGVITAVGSDVAMERIGSRVAVEPQRACKVCKQCKAGRYNLCPEIEFYATPPIDGAFCEYVKIQSEFAYDIPANISFDAAALIEPMSVCIWAAQKAKIEKGTTVLIAGAGPIGVVMAQVARAFGASDVVVTDVVEHRLEFVKKYGATRTINTSSETLGSEKFDVFVDACGVPAAVHAGILATGPAGRALLVGLGSDEMMLPVSHIQNNEIIVTGVFRYTNTWPIGIEFLASGKVDLDAIVTHHFGLSDVEAGLKMTANPAAMKVVIHPQQ
ncbi:NAD(P)-dependent alcohol dehydrogenase [Actinobacteria bacterium IMCC25003]|nr:NAD(P)-dependent alcohol dehydrogenase [Actinobacteria bacterium IMCC25003]